MPNKLHLECQYKKLGELSRKYKKVEEARSRAVAPYEAKMDLYEREVYNIAKRICIYYNDKTAIEALQKYYTDEYSAISIVNKIMEEL